MQSGPQDEQALKAALAKMQAENEALQRQINAASIVATAIHNISNVLNSASVNINLLKDLSQKFRLDHFDMATQKFEDVFDRETLSEEQILLINYFKTIGGHLHKIYDSSTREIELLDKHLEHIKQIVYSQTGYSQSFEPELIDLNLLLEEALHFSGVETTGTKVCKLEKNYGQIPQIKADKHKILQILTNLLINAKNALNESNQTKKTIILTTQFEGRLIKMTIKDNGVGIAKENIDKIFEQGFTTRRTGHGVGLYSAAKSAQEMEGGLKVESEGLTKGAAFILSLPIKP